MAVHLVKLCVGVSSVEDIISWREEEVARCRASGRPELIPHVTRMTPTRRPEILDGGSLYWVVSGSIQCRSPIVGLEPVTGDDGIKRCAIMMSPEVIRTVPSPKRPFQGWRYLKPEDAPRDLDGRGGGGEELPQELRSKLMEIGAW